MRILEADPGKAAGAWQGDLGDAETDRTFDESPVA
jgi:hypothetical protein